MNNWEAKILNEVEYINHNNAFGSNNDIETVLLWGSQTAGQHCITITLDLIAIRRGQIVAAANQFNEVHTDGYCRTQNRNDQNNGIDIAINWQ